METTNLSIDNKLKKSSGWQPWSSQKTRVSFRDHIDNRDCQRCGLFVYVSNMMTDNLDELKVIYFRGRHIMIFLHGLPPYHDVFPYSLFLFHTILLCTVQAWNIKIKRLI